MARIVTNRNWRNFCHRSEVPAEVLASQFDYLGEDEGSDSFFKYKGTWYHTSEFSRHNDTSDNWHGSKAESWSCGVMLRISDDGEKYQVGFWTI